MAGVQSTVAGEVTKAVVQVDDGSARNLKEGIISTRGLHGLIKETAIHSEWIISILVVDCNDVWLDFLLVSKLMAE